jgi:hypothetical protein
MVKTCPVLINNGVVTVVKFDDTEVQLPYIGYEASQINIVFENGRYSVAPKDYKEQTKAETKSQNALANINEKETITQEKQKTVKIENKKTTQKGKKNRKKKH